MTETRVHPGPPPEAKPQPSGTIGRVAQALGDLAYEEIDARDGMPTIEVPRPRARAALERVKGAGFDLSVLVTAVDRYPREPRFEVVWQFLSTEHADRLRVRTRVSSDDPSVPSIVDLWSGAAYSERECFDMFGVTFDGHVGLKRLLMPEEYDHFPLRKDFPHQGIEPDRLYRQWDKKRRQPESQDGAQLFEYEPGPPGTVGNRPPADHDQDDPLHGEPLQINMGPQHPATHGVLRLKITLDGETIREVEPVVGYLHRGKEKCCETLGWRKFFPHTDRMDYVQPLMNNIAYAMSLEKLAQLEIPERGQVIRVVLMELSRIMSHLIYIGTTAIDLGAVTIFFYAFNEREKIYSLLDDYTGHRMNNTYVRVGGVYADLDDEVVERIQAFVDEFPERIDEIEHMLTGNRIWYDRNHEVGALSADEAKAWSLTGPNLRATGCPHDLRKAMPYCGYEGYDFDVPVGTLGDCYDRYLVRMEEMRQSVRICRQALDRLRKTRGADFLVQDRRYVLPPKDEVHTSMEELIHQFKIVTDMRLPEGEAYVGVESSKGELGFYVVSDGTSGPLRCHVRAPSLMNVQVIPKLAHDRLLSDIVAIIGSLDFVMGEVDR